MKSILNKLIKISFFTGPFYLLLILFSLEIFSQENYEVLDRVVAVVEKDVITLSELKIEEEKVIQNKLQQNNSSKKERG